jgi:multicomponent Na+:H+ antiporter subunit D
VTANWIVLLLVIPLVAGTSALIRDRAVRRRAVLVGVSINLIVCVLALISVLSSSIHVSQMGNHPAPYGISLVIDPLSAIMLTIAGIITFAVALFSRATIDPNRERFAYYPLLAFLLMGINFAFLTGDLFTLYVAFEVMLMSSFVLLTLGGERGQIAGGLKYVTLNLISSTIFLVAAGLTYGVAGTLNMAHLAQRLAGLPAPGITTVLAVLFLIAFGIKAAIFPLYFWLPASYHTPPIAVTAMFGGLLTKVGIYSMLRVLMLIFPQNLIYLQPLILTLAGLTMIVGVLGAIAQSDIRLLLSFNIVGEIGYLLMGIGLFTPLSLTGVVFFMIHVILAKTALFFVSGIVYELQGSYQIGRLGGLQKSQPILAALFLVVAFSLAGLPPFSGFWAKLILIRAGVETQQYWIVAVALLVSLLILVSMMKIWHGVFWKSQLTTPQEKQFLPTFKPAAMRLMMAAVVILVGLGLLIGVLAEPTYALSEQAARGLVDPANYIQAVLPQEVGSGQ